MNVDIQDHAVFDSFEPDVVLRYLEAHRWTEIKRIPREMAVFELASDKEEPYRVWVPLSRKFRDYSRVMGSAFKTLAESEGKSQLQMLDDLQTRAIGDVVRVASEDRLDKANHTLLLADGIVLHEQAREMALAGAWNAAQGNHKKPIYPQGLKVDIVKFMRNLRLAQTERGSYIVKLISPINPQALDQLALDPKAIPPESPFERRAVVELLGGLAALRQAAYDTNRRGKFSFTTFADAVADGVSANLCDAVAPNAYTDFWRPVRVSVTWCDVISVPPPSVKTQIEFEPDLMKYVKEAATEFRKRNPEEIILRGAVTDLHRPSKQTKGAGEVRIYGQVNNHSRYVRVSLGQQDYELAVDAHKTYREVSVRGILIAKPGQFILDKPKNFRIAEDIG